MYVLVTYKNEEDQMKNERTRVVKTLYSYIFMVVLVTGTCKNEEDTLKNEGARVVATDLSL